MQRVDALLMRDIKWPVPKLVVRTIAMEEDCRLDAYLCSAGKPTCGWGETEGVQLGMSWTQEHADERFRQSLQHWGDEVRRMAPTATDGELAAFISLAYNIGLGAFATSTALKRHNAGDRAAAARAIGLFDSVRDPVTKELEVNKGLVARRARETALYLTGSETGSGGSPQAVSGESRLSRSPINQGGIASLGTGLLAALSGALEQFGGSSATLTALKGSMTALADAVRAVTGLEPIVLVGVGLAFAGFMVVRYRRQQREQGWA